MSTVTQETMNALCAVVQHLPIGTNLALLHFLWMLVNGSLLSSRGAIFPGLLSISLPPAAIRRAWAAFWGGAWDITDLRKKDNGSPAPMKATTPKQWILPPSGDPP